MRTICAVLAAVLVCLPASAATSDKAQLANELIQLSHLDETGAEALVTYLSRLTANQTDAEKIRKTGEEMRSDRKFREAVSSVTADILTSHLTEEQLRQLIAFYKSDTGKAWADAQHVVATERAPRVFAILEPPEKLAMALPRRTMADMRSLATATEAYATDANRYPDAKTIEDLGRILSPTYIKTPPLKDAWGTAYAYRVTADHQTFRFVSAGPDRKFDPSSLDVNAKPRPSDDIVFQNGEFMLAPPMR